MRNDRDKQPLESTSKKPEAQKYSKQDVEKGAEEGRKNGSPLSLPDAKAVGASKRRIPGEPTTESDDENRSN